jgi:transposase
VDDRRVLGGLIFVNRNGLRWRDAPAAHGPSKTLYDRWIRWSRMGVVARIMEGLACEGDDNDTAMIDATCLKARRTASRLAAEKWVSHCAPSVRAR